MNPKMSRPADPVAVLKRVIRYMLHYYKAPFALVVLCILINAGASVLAATFPQTLVDDYIVPMICLLYTSIWPKAGTFFFFDLRFCPPVKK